MVSLADPEGEEYEQNPGTFCRSKWLYASQHGLLKQLGLCS